MCSTKVGTNHSFYRACNYRYEGFDPRLKAPYCMNCDLDQRDVNIYSKDYNYCVRTKGKCDEKKMLRCAGCKTYYYCSKECQKLHWSHHKRFCKQIKKVRTQLDEDLVKIKERSGEFPIRPRGADVHRYVSSLNTMSEMLMPIAKNYFIVNHLGEITMVFKKPSDSLTPRYTRHFFHGTK